MSLTFAFYFSFRSPYSYLAIPQIEALIAEYDVRVDLRVVRPLAVRSPDFFQTVNPMWPRYLMKDTNRIAQMNGIAYRWPVPDPVVQDTQTRAVAPNQPYIMQVSRMGVAAAQLGRGFEFVRHAARLIWDGSTPNWNEGNHLIQCLNEAGLEPEQVMRMIDERPDELDDRIVANENAQALAGHWGVPLFVFDDEPFFGQDRIDHLIWRMKQHGLTTRD